jgi:luciferase family oxidoreductase group 1
LAAEMGLPFGFASHFAPLHLDAALSVYRERFTPSRQLARPYAMVGVNIVAAESDAQARRLATSQQMSFADLVRGERRLLQPPIDDIDDYWTPEERIHASQMLRCSIIGARDTVRSGLEALVDRTRADELIVVSDMYDCASRWRSFEIIADAASTLRVRQEVPITAGRG